MSCENRASLNNTFGDVSSLGKYHYYKTSNTGGLDCLRRRLLEDELETARIENKARFKRQTFHEPNLIAPIKYRYKTRSTFESIKFDKCHLG